MNRREHLERFLGRRSHSVLIRPRGTYLQVQWNGLDGTPFFVRARSKEHAQALFDALIQCADVAGVSLFIGGKFAGARDGHGS